MARGRPLYRPPFLVLTAVLLLSATMLASTPVLAETRLALVISNASYPSEIGSLVNPHKDGATIAAALQEVGFVKANIEIIKEADQPTLRQAVAGFVERVEKAGPDAVVFLYYSGHGAADRTDRGENYLIPVGARITLAKQLPILGVGLSEITKALERVPAKARFVVMDACRNVAFTKGLKDATKGFAPERKLDGTLLAFATRPGETAEDNNIYASVLASVLRTPGLRAEEVFKETQIKVAELSKGQQVPWTEDGLLARFKFVEHPSGPLQSASSVVAPSMPPATSTPKLPAPSIDITATKSPDDPFPDCVPAGRNFCFTQPRCNIRNAVATCRVVIINTFGDKDWYRKNYRAIAANAVEIDVSNLTVEIQDGERRAAIDINNDINLYQELRPGTHASFVFRVRANDMPVRTYLKGLEGKRRSANSRREFSVVLDAQ